ncbi:MAG: tRNA (adenosine(37)-N6)-threonylcarbamoyltransferase complex ATPase subunit type 1 TsaE [Alphaproteobacteria bacterium]
MMPRGIIEKSTTLYRDLYNLSATQNLANSIAPLLQKSDVIALYGELGAGKTSFARALIKKLGYKGEVPSPTFTLAQNYNLESLNVWHFDLYRILDPDELIELDIEEAMIQSVLLIEWPQRMDKCLPNNRLDIQLNYTENEESRSAIITGHGHWSSRLKKVSNEL